jgi:hypothetical protein
MSRYCFNIKLFQEERSRVTIFMQVCESPSPGLWPPIHGVKIMKSQSEEGPYGRGTSRFPGGGKRESGAEVTLVLDPPVAVFRRQWCRYESSSVGLSA